MAMKTSLDVQSSQIGSVVEPLYWTKKLTVISILSQSLHLSATELGTRRC